MKHWVKKQYAEIIDNGVTLAQQVAQFVSEQPHIELVMQPQLASVLFRFRPESDDATTVALLNQRIGDALLAFGSANVGVTEADGVTCLKLTLLNPTVCLAGVKILLESVKACAMQLLKE